MESVGTIIAPDLPNSVPIDSQWLSGQGVGAWFHIQKTNKNEFRIRRYTPNGEIDCDRIFQQEKNAYHFDITQSYQFTHVSHCSKCKIIQNNITFVFIHHVENNESI